MTRIPRNIIIGCRLKQLRINNGLTQTKVAEELEISPQHYGTLERGVNTCSLENIFKLCDIYKVPVYSVLGGLQPYEREYNNNVNRLSETIGNLNDEHKDVILTLISYFAKMEQK